MPTRAWLPLDSYLTAWPENLLPRPDLSLFAVVDHESRVADGVSTSVTRIEVLGDVTLALPGVDVVTVQLLPAEHGSQLTVEVDWTGPVAVRLVDLTAALEVRSGLLVPVMATADGWEPLLDEAGEPAPFSTEFHAGQVVWDEAGGIRFELDGALSLPPFMVGQTGVVVEVTGASLSFSGLDLPPTSAVQGVRGLLVESATVHLPPGIDLPGLVPESITVTDGTLGTGGFSAAITGSWEVDWDGTTPSGDGAGSLLGFAFGLESMLLRVVQDSVTGAELVGRLALPFFDQVLTVAVAVDAGGTFAVTVTGTPDDQPAVGADPSTTPSSPAVATLTVPGVGELRVTGLGLVRDDEGDALLLSGELDLMLGAPALTWPTVTVCDLRIGADGAVRIPGGWLDLQEPIALDLYGFGLEITRIGFGTEDDGRRWVGFDGGLRLTELLPAGVSARGLRVVWNPADPADDPQITLDGVGVSFGVPGAFAFEGEVALTEDASGAKVFSGALRLALEALDVGIDAEIAVGRGDGFTFVFVYLEIGLPIPIGATGAALYGMQGLFAMNMAPTVQGGDWYGWYKDVPERFQVTDAGKWSSSQGSWAFGAGLSLGTLADGGFAVSTKALLAVLLPGPVVLVEGKADLLTVPAGLDSSTQEGTLSLLAALDGRAGTILLGIDAGWSLGKVIDISASSEAFFDVDRPDAWHVWIGQDVPETARIRADVLSLFHADSWLMLDSAGIGTGMAVSLGDSWRFGPVRVTMTAWIEGSAALSWRPAQLSGSLGLGGEIGIEAGPFALGLMAQASLSGQTPAPFEVAGIVSVSVELPFPLKDLDVELHLEWAEEAVPTVADPWSGALCEHDRCTESWTPVAGGGPDQAPDPDAPLVPLDAHVLLAFAHPMGDVTAVADNPAVPAPTSRIGAYDASYSLTDVQLFRRPRDRVADEGEAAAWDDVTDSVFGAWTVDAAAGSGTAGTRLQLFARTPFAFTRFTSRRFSDAFLAANPGWPCGEAPPDPSPVCVDWRQTPDDTRMPPLWEQGGACFASEATLTVADGELKLGTDTDAGGQRRPGTLWIALPEPAAEVLATVEVFTGDAVVLRAWSGDQMVGSDFVIGHSEPLHVLADGIDAMTLDWGLSNECILVSVCWRSQTLVDTWAAWESGQDALVAAAERWSSAEPVLAPDSHYLLVVGTRALLAKGGVEVQRVDGSHAVQFRTGGPPGVVPEWVEDPAVAQQNTIGRFPHAGVLADLGAYVRWTVPDPGAQPVLRGYDVGCEFDADHVQQMYGADLVVRLRDGDGRPVLDTDGAEVVFANAWEEAPTTTLTSAESAWLTALDACTGAVEWSLVGGDWQLRAQVPGLLVDDFSLLTDAWSAHSLDPSDARSPHWYATAGELRQDVDLPQGAALVSEDVDVADVALEAVGRAASGAFGIVFGWRGERDHHRLVVYSGRTLLVRVRGGDETVLATMVGGFAPDVATLVAVQVRGARIRCQIGERLAADVTDDDAVPSGLVGLFALGATARFDRVMARAWPGSALAPARQYTAELMASRPLFAPELEDLSGFEVVELAGGAPATGSKAASGVATIVAAAGGSVVAFAESQTADLVVETSARPAGPGVFGLVARHDGTRSYLALELAAGGGRALVEHTGGSGGWTAAKVLWHDSAEVRVGNTYALALRCEGDVVTVSVDGVEHVVPGVHVGGPGRCGLLSGIPKPAGCAFSDVVVRSAPRVPVHHWAFTTSRHAGLAELLDTFPGTAWALDGQTPDAGAVTAQAAALDQARATLDAARAELAAAVAAADVVELPVLREQAVAAVQALHGAAAGAYEALHAQLGQQYRPVPPVVEVSAVQAGGDVLALLLDLPEPLPWGRVTCTLTGPETAPADSVVAWSADGGRVVLARADGAPFTTGAWRIDLVLHLDVGAERAVWRRGSSSAPEVGALSFRLPPAG